MTDETSLTETSADGKTFQIVPTLDGYMELSDRIAHLEASTPATGGDDDELAAGLDTLNTRVDRHRAELEEIKRRYNALVRYIGASQLPVAQAAATGDTITPAQTMTGDQPSLRNMIQ